MMCNANKVDPWNETAYGQAIIGLNIDMSQFRSGIEQVDGVVYKTEGSVHSFSDGQYHAAGEKVLWARDNPLSDTWYSAFKSQQV